MNKRLLILMFILLISANIFAYIPKEEMKIFAVTSSNIGMDANLIIEIKPGTGKIFSNVNSQVGSLTQESERNAVNAAEKITSQAKGKYDYFFEIQSNASSIDGPSAGAAMALLIVSMLNDTDLSGKVSITGTITSDGYVGDVGGISAKAKKAADVGIKLFMIPIGTRKQAITTESGQSQVVDIVDYAYSNWGLKVVEVETIDDILEYSKMNIDEIDINSIVEKKEAEYYPEKIQYSEALVPMRAVVDKYVIDAKSILLRTENNINSSTIKDSSIVQGLLSLVDYSKEAIVSAEENSKNNYLYTSANDAFLAKIYLITIDEIVKNPSIISTDSTIYNLRIEEIEKKIALTENRSKLCSLDKLEWCIGAKQRIVWAKNKIADIKSNKYTSSTGIDKIMNYSYALAWIEIANDFLDIGITNNGPNFVESEQFKDLAQKYIVDVENELVLSDEEALSDEDIQRRITAAKKDFEMGWYVTSLYDSASAKAVLISRKENSKESFDENVFLDKYNKLSELRSPQEIKLNTNVWSKMFFDHSLYHFKQYQFYKSKNTTKAETNIKTANSIVNISKELYIIESIVHSYYNDAGIIDVVVPEGNNQIIIDINDSDEIISKVEDKQNVIVYKKEDSSKNNTIMYVIIGGLFLMIISIVIELEKHNNKKSKIQKNILELEQKLTNGQISKFTYEDMKKSYLKELREIEEKEYRRHTKENIVISEQKKNNEIKPKIEKPKKDLKKKVGK